MQWLVHRFRYKGATVRLCYNTCACIYIPVGLGFIVINKRAFDVPDEIDIFFHTFLFPDLTLSAVCVPPRVAARQVSNDSSGILTVSSPTHIIPNTGKEAHFWDKPSSLWLTFRTEWWQDSKRIVSPRMEILQCKLSRVLFKYQLIGRQWLIRDWAYILWTIFTFICLIYRPCCFFRSAGVQDTHCRNFISMIAML